MTSKGRMNEGNVMVVVQQVIAIVGLAIAVKDLPVNTLLSIDRVCNSLLNSWCAAGGVTHVAVVLCCSTRDGIRSRLHGIALNYCSMLCC